MATATKKARAAMTVAGRPHTRASTRSPLEFAVHEDNTGEYHWEIVGRDGASLARSVGFASHHDAERAARHVYEGAGGARFEPRLEDGRPLVSV
jgi:uncharacterized protein YegP (UPF0339 family)